jgi:hypothetical protein
MCGVRERMRTRCCVYVCVSVRMPLFVRVCVSRVAECAWDMGGWADAARNQPSV